MMNKLNHITLFISTLIVLSAPVLSQKYIADFTVAKEEVLRSIPLEYISKIKDELVVAYQHTSHGTHVSRGMFGLHTFKAGDEDLFGISAGPMENMLEFRDFALESYAPTGIDAADLGRDETAFIQTTRNYLDAPENATVNVVMWAWSRIAGHDVAGNYLPGMDSLISEYGPGGSKIGSGTGQREIPVTFVYMTGHSIKDENTGPLNPKEQAELINSYCNANQLFSHDYYSIDTHTMDDIYYEDTGDNGDSDNYGGNFYEDWQNSHVLGEHYYENWHTIEGHVNFGTHTTQHITSNRKAYAMWWILARIAGWNGEIPVSSIQISSDQDTSSVMTGDELQYSASVLPVEATNPDVLWTVINGNGSATISSEGLLTGGLPGDVEVLATAMDGSGHADTLALTILDPLIPVTDIGISTEGDIIDMDAGTTLQCSTTVLPVDATNPTIIWSLNSISGSALISATGLVRALSEGMVEVIATSRDGSLVADTIELSITGSVILVSQIEISSAGGAVEVSSGAELQFTATVLPEDATNPSVAWSVINRAGSATITPQGLLSGGAPGEVDVVALAMDISGKGDTMTVRILAIEVPVSSITLSTAGGVTTLDEGASLQCSATVLPLDATNQSLDWTVVNGSGSASVSTGGLLTAISAGTVEVVATAVDGSGVSGSQTLTINGPATFLEEEDNTSILLYPNPSNGRFFVDVGDKNIERIELVSSDGSLVQKTVPVQGKSLIELDLSDRQAGVYFVHVFSEELSYIRRVIIAR